ncbi:GNAT family N-acetyltransferase [Sinomicrobium weinanense]|uniref:GNAT family N-acetyltransferase n=1 Tax=Sinomicrobium weinanense TaxID=2842200 RepID=UPI001FFC4EF2|nr:GNAT family N-acetyltransferase [Sinomicrobium weinanense]
MRKGQLADLEELRQLFADTISTICRSDYNNEQIHVWASGIEDKDRWHRILTSQQVWVTQNNEKITGFCTLDKGHHIDLLFVHKDYQRQGIARELYNKIEKEAIQRGQSELTVNASITARPFFEKAGFEVLTKQKVIKQGIELTNYKMKKQLDKTKIPNNSYEGISRK